MKDRLRVAAFVVVLAVVWGVGFLWARGDLRQAGDETRATQAEAATSSPSATPPTRTVLVPSKASREARSSLSARTTKAPGSTAGQPLGVAPGGRRPAPQPLPPAFEFRVATFNVLGSKHTAPGGNAARYASGTARVSGVVTLLADHHVSVAGFQEFQVPQRRAFANRAPGWSMYPRLSQEGSGPNTVVWRTDVWERVDGSYLQVPYFHGKPQPMPWVLLRHRATGVVVYFSTFHNPASTQGPAQRYRTEATRREIALFRRFDAAGMPQVVTGDMNERAEYFCRLTAATSLKAAQGGSNDGRCRPPADIGIDWIFGSSHVRFSGFGVDRSPLVRRTSDHPFVSTTVRVDAIDYDRAYQPPG